MSSPEKSDPTLPAAPVAPKQADSLRRNASRARPPHAFIENQGQVDARVQLYFRAGRQTLWLTKEGVVFDLRRVVKEARAPTAAPRAQRPNLPQDRLVFTQQFLGANQGAAIEPRRLLPGTYNYYLGNDPARWRTGVRGYGEAVYRDVWEGIDLRLYANGRHLEQEFVVRPGGHPSRIRVAYEGIDGLHVAQDGTLLIRTSFGELRESPPRIYQEIDGTRVAVNGRFKLLGSTAYTFEVDPYRPRYALVIDPTLVYATYLGGTADDKALGIAVDDRGHAYVAGDTASLDFPTQNGLQPPGGGLDIFIAELNRAGDGLKYSTYFGGSGDETDPAIAIDAAGGAYVVGSTTSSDLPTHSSGVPLQTSLGGGRDAFVVRLDSTGALAYSTYLGGSGDETGVGIVVDPACLDPALGCSVYVSGTTASAGFLPASGAQPTFGGVRDAFVVKLDATGSTLLASTYLGGSGAEDAGVLAVGPDGGVYVTGQTSSANFPKKNPIQSSLNGPADAFIAKLSADLSTLIYSTYFGGSGTDGGNQIVVDTLGNIYVAGQTNSSDLTPVNAVQSTPGGDFDGFVLKLDPTGSTVLYLTYLGGPGFDDAFSIGLDDAGSAYITGKTSGGLPTNLALDTSPQPTIGSGGGTGAYAAKLGPSGNQLLYLTYLGNATNEDAGMLAVDAAKSAYVAIGTSANRTSVLAGNLGPSGSFQTSTGTAWATGGASNFSNAVGFTISGAQTYRLAQFRFAANWFAGTNSVNVGFYGGSDLNTATLLESFSFSATAQATAQLFTAVSTARPLLIPGNTYFIALSVDASTTTWGWQWNDQGQVGYFARSGTGAWSAVAGVTPAFDVSATPEFAGTGEDAYVTKLATQSADLSATKFANPSPVLSGANLTYTITVHNNGPDPAVNVFFADDVPAGTTFQSLTPNANCATPAVNGAGTVSCSVGTLANGASATYTLVVKVTAASGSVSNTASVATLTPDPNPANDSATVATSVSAAGAISGIVTQGAGGASPGAPIQGAMLTVRDAFTGGLGVAVTVFTDVTGHYTANGLPPENYKVTAEANGFAARVFDNQPNFTLGNVVTVNAGATTSAIDFALPGNAGGITGKVTLLDGVTPVPNASVAIRGPGGEQIIFTGTDAAGNYNTQRRLAPGGYLVRVTAAGFPVTYYDGATSVFSATLVAVNANVDTPNINVKLSSAAGGISGQVTSATTGAPLLAAIVTVREAATGGVVIAGVGTDAGGHYATGATLAPGLYKVTAAAPGAETITYDNRFSVGAGDPVTVTAGNTTTGIDIALPLLGGITGHVTNAADGTAIAGAVVDVWDYGSNGFVTSATTAGDGSYTINNLNPLQAYRARARVSAGAGTNFGMVFFDNKPSAGTADVVTVPAGATTTIDFALTAAGGILGTVTDATTGAPIQGVQIDIVDGASTNFSINDFINFSVTTDANGNFNTGRVLADGVYKVRARKFNSGYIQTFHPNGRDLSTATTVTVTAGADVSGADIAMQMGGTITGTIRDRASGLPISGASVAAQRVRSSNFFGDFTVTTDANGNYTITGLHTGEWLISAQATGHIIAWYGGADPNNLATDFDTTTPIQITGASAVSNVDLNLQLGGAEIRGRVTRNDNGQPVTPGIPITIWGPWPRATTITQIRPLTNEQGDYSASGLSPGRYFIQADRSQVPNGTAIGFYPFGAVSRATGTFVTVADGDVATADFQVFGFTGDATPRAIRGTLRDASNNPIREAFIFAFEPTATSLVRVVGVFDDGSFVMDGLAPGRYLINANTEKTFATTSFPDETTLNTATLIDLTAGDKVEIGLVLPDNAGTVTGTITRSDTGQPVRGAVIGVRTFLDAGVVGAVSQTDGTFLARGVTPGSGKIRVSAPGFVTKFFKVGVPGGALTLEDGSFITVSSGTNTPNINVVLDPTGGALTGTVRDQGTLEPVVATVAVIHDAATGNRVIGVATDANGAWRTEGLGPGAYKVEVFDALAARHAAQWYSGETTLLSADPVTVGSVGVTGGIDFLVSPNRGSVSGTAFLSDGKTPVATNAVIEILDAATGGLVRRALTGSNGQYSAQGLAPGNGLYVAHTRGLGFADQFSPGVPTRATATPLTVTSGGDTPGINFSLTLSSDITGAISYGGAQQGPLRVRLFRDAGLTQQVYETVIQNPNFSNSGQPYGFAGPAPDTRGLLPGTYFASAFVDSNGNGAQDASEAFGQLSGSVTIGENSVAGGHNFTIADPAFNPNTQPVADPGQAIVVQGSSNNSIILIGQDAETTSANLRYSVIGGPSHGTLSITDNPQERLYTPSPGFTGTDVFTFTVTDRGFPDNCGVPNGDTCFPALTSAPATVTIQITPSGGVTTKALSAPVIIAPGQGAALGNIEVVENATGALVAGSTVKVGLPSGMAFHALPTVSFEVSNGAVLNPPVLESAGVVSFTLGHASTQGPASILVSAIMVDIPPDFLPPDVTSADVLATVFGPNPALSGVSQSVKNGTAVTSAAGPILAGVSPASAGLGAVARTVVLTGANFAPDATVSFGAGVFVTAVSVDSPTQITATLDVSFETPLGSRDVTLTNVSAGQSATRTDGFRVTGTPAVIGVSGPLTQGLDNQLVTITGVNFAPPTTTPPDLLVSFTGSGITLPTPPVVGYTNETTITVVVNVAADAAVTLSDVTVTNPDGGSGTALNAVSVAATGGLAAPPSKSSPTTSPTPPTITSLSTGSGPIGSSVTINGSRPTGTPSVSFAGLNGVRVSGTITGSTSSSLTVTVPPQATTGNVTVAVNGLLSNGVLFTVTTPVLAGVVPGSVTTNPSTAKQVQLTLSGSRFASGATVSFSGPAGDITQTGSPVVSADGTTITLTVSIPSTPQQPGARDVTVTNPGVCSTPALPGCLSSTLAGGFQIQLPPPAGFNLTLPDFPDPSTYLPSDAQVSLTRLASGACDPTTKVVTPAGVKLRAQFVTTVGLTPPASVTFSIAPSAIPGTATNEDCELDPTNPSKDFSIGAANLASQQVVVADSGGGVYQTTLYSYDWGGKVTVTVTGTTGGTIATGSLTLPIDSDCGTLCDDMPDGYEKNAGLNAGQTGANVLNFQSPDQNGNGTSDRNERFAKDGLANFEKYRGVYMVGPAPGNAGVFGGFQRLGAGTRHLFVRGRGFRDDPAVPSGFCGINPTTGAPVPDVTLSAANPCPSFEVGAAFPNIGVTVHNVSGSFTAATELPRSSLVNPTLPTLDMATVVYDGVDCKGTEACDTTSKFGVRQWGFSTLGYTTPYGTATTYGSTSVFKRAIESYFTNRPYQHRINDPSRVVTAPDGTPMLAPVIVVGDSSSTGADNGLADSGEATVSGQLSGDTYIAGSFSQQLSALDVNNDKCVELPTVADPTTIGRCTPNVDAATSPSATKQQVVRTVVTHELGHLTGVNTHTGDSTDIMYLSTINFLRDGHFSSYAAGLIQIHNKGLQ